MKTLWIKTYLIGLLGGMFYACDTKSQQEQKKTAITDTVNVSTELSQTDTSDATPSDSSQQRGTGLGQRDGLLIKGEENQYDILLPTDILFDFDKATLRPEGLGLLQKVKQHFTTHGVDQLHVWGHTDSKGNDQYNFKLSQRRAIAVADWLKKNVKMKGLVMSIGRGEQEPLVPNENPDGSDNPENRQQNRRVTLSVVKYPNATEMMKKPTK
ncbi:hypothetical protein GCM10028807_45330 [Spirosoma daeguense]